MRGINWNCAFKFEMWRCWNGICWDCQTSTNQGVCTHQLWVGGSGWIREMVDRSAASDCRTCVNVYGDACVAAVVDRRAGGTALENNEKARNAQLVPGHPIMWVKECHFYHPWLGMVNVQTSHKNGDDWGCFLSVLPTSPWICWWFSHCEICENQKTQWDSFHRIGNSTEWLGFLWATRLAQWSAMVSHVVFPVWQNWVVSEEKVSLRPPPARWGSLDFNKGGTLELIHSFSLPPSLPPSFAPSLIHSLTHLVTMDAAVDAHGHAWTQSPYRKRGMLQWRAPGPELYIASAGCCGGLLDLNRCQREGQIECQRECQNRYQIEWMPERMSEYMCQENMSEYSHI